MTKLEQAARQALSTDEALMALELILRDGIEHGNWPLNKNCEDGLEAITALREALAEQTQQEPVAWVWLDDWLNDGYPEDCFSRVNHQNKTPLYTAPVRTKDLTDDELASACGWKLGDPMYEWVVDIGRWAIAADREKNK